MGKDLVNNPSHYGGASNTYEVIKVIEAHELDKDFYLGNVLKYVLRANKKGIQLEDLRKAQWYLKRKIEKLEDYENARNRGFTED